MICTTCFLVAWLSCSAADGVEVGESVIVIRRAEIKVEDEVVDVVSAGTALTIQSVQGDWLEVSNGDGGWIKNSFVMKPADALEHFNTALRVEPGRRDILFARANAYRSLEMYREAIDDFNRLIRLDPQAAAFNGRGRTWFEMKEYEKAIDDFTEAIERSPDVAMLYNNRSAAYELNGDYERAVADMYEAHRRDPDHEFVQANRRRLKPATKSNRSP